MKLFYDIISMDASLNMENELQKLQTLSRSFTKGAQTELSTHSIAKMSVQNRMMEKNERFLKYLKSVLDIGIYVGIPEQNAPRSKGEMNNATLLYIHTHGSPKRNLPPRPLLEPALKANDEKIANDLALVSKYLLDGNHVQAMRAMVATGQDAVNIIRGWFTDPQNNWADVKRATQLRKINKLRGKKKKEALASFEAGEPVGTPLIDTGELRKSITYVLGETVAPKYKDYE